MKRALGDANGATGRLGGTLRNLGKVAKWAGLAVAAGLGFALKVGFEELAQAQRVTAQTNAVLKSTGKIANVTAGQVSNMAESLMALSGVDDEAIQSGENLLLTFTKIRNEAGKGNDIFNQATLATLNLSVAMGKDMSSAAILVGKALNDPIRGVTALTRAGIQLTEAQKATILAMVESGNVMGAQKIILEELTTQFGGSAKAAGETLPGQLAILKESAKNLLAEGLQPLIPGIVALVQGFIHHLPRIRQIVSEVFGAVRGFIVGTLIPAFTVMRARVAEVVAGVVKVFHQHRPALLAIWNDLKSTVQSVAQIFRDVIIPVLKVALPAAIQVAVPVVRVIAAVVAALASALATAASAANSLVSALQSLPSGDFKLLDLFNRGRPVGVPPEAVAALAPGPPTKGDWWRNQGGGGNSRPIILQNHGVIGSRREVLSWLRDADAEFRRTTGRPLFGGV